MQVYDGLDDDTDQPIVRGGQGRSAQEVTGYARSLAKLLYGLLALAAVIYLLSLHR